MYVPHRLALIHASFLAAVSAITSELELPPDRLMCHREKFLVHEQKKKARAKDKTLRWAFLHNLFSISQLCNIPSLAATPLLENLSEDLCRRRDDHTRRMLGDILG